MYYKDTKIRKIIGNINLFPNFVTLIVETNTVTRMKDLIITAVIKVYQYDELNEADQALVKTAKDATARSYSPYSHFSVGAAVLLGNGIVVTGTNQENAAYPSGLCAERTTLFYANSQYPDQPVVTLAIAARTEKRFYRPTDSSVRCRLTSDSGNGETLWATNTYLALRQRMYLRNKEYR